MARSPDTSPRTRKDKRKDREEVDDEEMKDMELDESSLTHQQLHLIDALCLKFGTTSAGVELLVGPTFPENKLRK
eukprot:30192-Eustigmatos_ZCMA.PRE.1